MDDGAPAPPGQALLPGAGTGRRRWWVLPLRIAVSVGILAVLVSQIPDFRWADLLPEWNASTALWLATAAVLTVAGVVLSALRWQTVLTALDMGTPLRRLVSLYFAGQFVSSALPSTIGGDVVRIARLSRDNGRSADTFASVVLERLTGWLVLPLITFVGLALDPGLRDLGRSSLAAAAVATTTLVLLVLVLVAAENPRLGGRFRSSQGWRRFVGAVHLGVDRLRRHPRVALSVLSAGVAFQLVLCLAALAAARALGIDQLGLTAVLAFYPAVLMAQVLPIGIAGLGVREGALVLFLTPLGVPAEQAIAFGLLIYLLNLGAGLLGAPSFAVGDRPRGTVRAEQREQPLSPGAVVER